MIRYLRRGFCRNKMQYCINKKILDIENSPLTRRKEIVMIFTGIFAVVYGIFMIIFGFTKNMNIIGASVWIALLAVIPYFLLFHLFGGLSNQSPVGRIILHYVFGAVLLLVAEKIDTMGSIIFMAYVGGLCTVAGLENYVHALISAYRAEKAAIAADQEQRRNHPVDPQLEEWAEADWDWDVDTPAPRHGWFITALKAIFDTSDLGTGWGVSGDMPYWQWDEQEASYDDICGDDY